MRATHLLSLLAFVFFVPINARAQVADTAAKIQQVERGLVGKFQAEGDSTWTIKERMARYQINGVSIAVIRNYKIEWAKGYGWADVGAKIPVTPQTLFQAGSVSKSLNAIGVLKLAQDKKIDLYTDINTYLHSWKFHYDTLMVLKGKKITIANLLSHTAGLTVHGFGGYERGAPMPTIEQVLNGKKPANSAAVTSAIDPGLKYKYSGGGIVISQLIVTDVSGELYAGYMYDNVLKPMDMTSSTYQQPPVDKDSTLLSAGYYANGREVPGKYHVYPEQAAAGLWTNPTDLAKYIIETQLAYEGRSQKVLNQQFTKLRLTPYVDKRSAFGVFIDDLNGTSYFEHDGADEGFICEYYGSLEGGNGAVVMVNGNNGNFIIPEIMNSIAKAYDFKGLNKSKLVKNITVPDSVLQSYTGFYRLAANIVVNITREGSNLYGQATGQGKIQMLPETQTKFLLKDAQAEVEFTKDEHGQVIKLVLYQNGAHEAKRINSIEKKIN